MRPRDVLAENLKKLMAATPGLRTIEMLVAAGGGTTGTLDRIKRKEAATGVDNLEPLAEAFGIKEPWKLLVPTLTAEAGADGRPVVGGMPDWPFPKVPRDHWDRLDDADKGHIQRVLLKAINECLQGTADATPPTFDILAPETHGIKPRKGGRKST